MPSRRCSECPKSLGKDAPATKKTCSRSCREKRARRLKKEQQRDKRPEHVQEVHDVLQSRVRDVAHEVMKEELRPVVREQMTGDVLARIGNLVELAPAAIKALELDLESQDETIRQRAATLILRYTLGNPSVAPAPAEQAPSPMTVVFNVPRPGDVPADQPEADEDLRLCTDCDTAKPADQFVGSSTRCTECHAKLQEQVRARFG